MAISYVGYEFGAEGNSNTIVVDVPAGVQDGDLLLFGQTRDAFGNTTGAWDTPSNSINIDEFLSTDGRDMRVAAHYRIASSEPASYTMGWTGTADAMSASILALRGVDQSVPFDISFTTAQRTAATNDEDPSNAAITTVTPDCWIVVMQMINWLSGDGDALAAPTGYTLRGNTTSLNGRVHNQAHKYESGAAGLKSPGDWLNTVDLGTSESVTYTFAIRPASESSVFTQVLKSTFAITDAQPGQIVSGRRPGERIELTDSMHRSLLARVIKDTLAVTDFIQVQAINVISREKSEQIPITDSLIASFQGTFPSTLLDALQATDFLRVEKAIRLNQLDTVSLDDFINVSYALARPLQDVIPELFDQIVKMLNISLQVSDRAIIRDNVIATYVPVVGDPSTTFTKLLVEQFMLVDSFIQERLLGPQFKSSFDMDDSLIAEYKRNRQLVETVSVTDSILANELRPVFDGVEVLPIVLTIGQLRIEINIHDLGD